MTMKKRFLGLALAAAVALPATTAYANTTTISMDENDTRTHNVTVEGSVRTKTGHAPAGKIEVELPTKMAFTVDQDSKLTGATYNVTNKSQNVGVDLFVESFSEADNINGINVLPKNNITSESYRHEVALTLTSNGTEVDLGNLSEHITNNTNKLTTINANSTANIVLNGKAGAKPYDSGDAHENVDTEGASENFTLVFKIQKTK